MTIETAKALAARHGGQIEREILWLVGEVERLKKELIMQGASENAQGCPQEAPGQAVAPLFVSGPPSDEALLAFLRASPCQTLADICGRFGVTCSYSTVFCGPEGRSYGYTPEAQAIRKQLQRLRKARRIRSKVQRWMI
jgi:hypothetical protein